MLHPASSPPARAARLPLRLLLGVLLLGVLLTPAVPGPAAGAPAYAAPAALTDDPLSVEISGLDPAVIPAQPRSTITVTGTVTNVSEEQWRVIKVYPLTSATPFTTPEELTAAAASDPTDYIGNRITSDDVFDTIDVLDPGDSAAFSVSVRRSQLLLSGDPGVYWLGIHALGETDAGREELALADGRDRVLVPLDDPPAPRRRGRQPVQPTLDTALVVPLRHSVTYDVEGRLADPDTWAADLAKGGVLGRLGDLASAAGARPLTWLVDPAVTDAVARLGRDNPPRSLADSAEPGGGTDGDTGDTGAGEGEQSGDEADAAEGAASARAAQAPPAAWLTRLRAAVASDQLLVLPYGDLDVAAAADVGPDLYRLARRRSDRTIEALSLPAAPAVAPPGGLLDEAGFGLVPRESTLVVGDELLDDDTRARAPGVIRTLGHRAYVSNTAVLGGSGPRQRSVFDVQQRLLAESLVRLLDKRGPLVFTVPTEAPPTTTTEDEPAGPAAWDAAEATALFDALDDAPWVRLTTLGGLADRKAWRVSPEQLRYPERVEDAELGSDVLGAALQLSARGRLLDSILPLNDTVARQFDAEALTTASYADREAALSARRSADLARSWIDERLASITVETPPSVTLSSDTGRLSADVVNGLEQTVRISITAATDPGVEVTNITPNPIEELGPGQRATVRMEAEASNLNVHSVSLVVANQRGQPVGSAATFPLRANRVSQVIWVVIGGGALLLLTTIGIRLVRRVRAGLAARREPARAPDAEVRS